VPGGVGAVARHGGRPQELILRAARIEDVEEVPLLGEELRSLTVEGPALRLDALGLPRPAALLPEAVFLRIFTTCTRLRRADVRCFLVTEEVLRCIRDHVQNLESFQGVGLSTALSPKALQDFRAHCRGTVHITLVPPPP